MTLTETDEKPHGGGAAQGRAVQRVSHRLRERCRIRGGRPCRQPQAPFVPINAVAVQVADGSDPATVAAAIGTDVAGTKGYVKSDAVALIPGVASITQTFGILVGLTFVIGIVVIGFFFLILTVQKLKSFTLLRAIERPPPGCPGWSPRRSPSWSCWPDWWPSF